MKKYTENQYKEMDRINTNALNLIDEWKYLEAVEEIHSAFRQGLVSYRLYNTLGRAYLKNKNNERAASNFKRSLEIMPSLEHALSVILSHFDDPDKIETEMKDYQKLTGVIHANYARALKKLNDIDKAIKHYEEAVKLGHRGDQFLDEIINYCEENSRYHDADYFREIQQGFIEP